jgi:glycosyltransferase involved in cell wall biosynthesis
MHFRVGETDGVSLEMAKWKKVFEKMGHKVYMIAGESGIIKAENIPSISYRNKKNIILKDLSYVELKDLSEDELAENIEFYYDEIMEELFKLPEMDVIFANNIFSLGHNISAAKAVYDYSKEKNIKLIGHHHDFYWEREYYANPTSKKIVEYLNNYFPPKDIDHIVINSIAKKSLKNYKGVDSFIIPNVFDFSGKLWKEDSYNLKILEKLNIKENDFVFLQATRVVQRKAIELAIDTINIVKKNISSYYNLLTYNGKKCCENSKIFFVLPGLNEEPEYTKKLVEYALEKNVNMIFAENICAEERNENEEIFSLWDFYAISDFITYPSVEEGFGNQFLEAVFAKKPILIYNYPVYDYDIEPLGFQTVSLGNKVEKRGSFYKLSQEKVEKAAEKILSLLFDKKKVHEYTENNFKLAKEYFSYDSLEKKLSETLFEINKKM